MAQITQRDVMLLFTMGLAVVAMSFVFPALGLGGSAVAENEVPELSVNTDRFDFAGEAPDPPGGPASTDLVWDDNRTDQLNQMFPRGDTTNGIEIGLLPPQNSTGRPLQISIAEWSSSSLVYQEQIDFTAEGQTATFANESMGLEAQFEVLEYDQAGADRYTIRTTIVSVRESGGWLSGVTSVAESTGATIGWLAESAIWAALFVIGLIVNVVVVSGEVGFYFVELISWLVTSYTSIVASADSWAAVFVALPGILLSVVLGKFVIVGISLLPTT